MPRRLMLQEFITRANETHEGEYLYNEVIYKNGTTKAKIYCLRCSEYFMQTPAAHLIGQGCPNCAPNKLVGFEGFLSRSKDTYGEDRFDYSRARYINYTTKIEIGCLVCGKWYKQDPRTHIDTKYGCPYCAGRANRIKQDYYDIGQKMGYNWIGEKAPNTVMDKSKWQCVECGHIWSSRFCDIKAGYGCPECAKLKLTGRPPVSFEEFVARAIEIHGNRFEYNESTYQNTGSKVSILCKTCGTKFQQRASSHLDGIGCSSCVQSKGEELVRAVLSTLGIAYEREKQFPNCRNKLPLPFDFHFIINETQFLVEYDGPHHTQLIERWGGQNKLNRTKKSDALKTAFAASNGFHLIRIPYTDFDNIETILKTEIQKHTHAV